MHAAVIELETLPDPVRAGAQDDDLFPARGVRFVLGLVAGVEVRRLGFELRRARVHPVEDGRHAAFEPGGADFGGAPARKLREVRIRKAVLFGAQEE